MKSREPFIREEKDGVYVNVLINFGYVGHKFKTMEEAEEVLSLCRMAYNSGVKETQKNIKEALGIF